MNQLKVRRLLDGFLQEDIGDGDITSEAIFPSDKRGEGFFKVKERGIIAGLSIIETTYKLLDPDIKVELFVSDGDKVEKGQEIAKVSGHMGKILTGERTILNLIQRMSGIATTTAKCVSQLADPQIKVCDTRKTMPGLRIFDSYGVRVGGGKNHRQGLYDGVMIKDNHIAFAGSIQEAVARVKEHVGHMVNIEVETESRQQVLEAISAGADVIMFDNRSPEEVKEFAKLVPEHITREISGGITLENIHTYRHTGADFISLGFLTHSVIGLDISLNVE